MCVCFKVQKCTYKDGVRVCRGCEVISRDTVAALVIWQVIVAWLWFEQSQKKQRDRRGTWELSR